MADCECLAGCPFFNDKMKEKIALASMFKRQYCREDNSECARFMIFKKLGKPAVPADLYPNMYARAKKILEENNINI